MRPFNAVTHKDGGEKDMIAFDNPDDGDSLDLENIPVQARGYEEKLVVVDNPDDFADEGEEVTG